MGFFGKMETFVFNYWSYDSEFKEKFRVLKEICGHFFNPPTQSIWSIYRDTCMVPYKTFVTLISGGITSQINTAVKLNTHEMRTMILQHQVAQQQPIQVKWGFLNLNCTTGPKKFSIHITMAAIFSLFYLVRVQFPGYFYPALWLECTRVHLKHFIISMLVGLNQGRSLATGRCIRTFFLKFSKSWNIPNSFLSYIGKNKWKLW